MNYDPIAHRVVVPKLFQNFVFEINGLQNVPIHRSVTH